MTASELERFKHSYRNWIYWFRTKVDSHNPKDIARRLGVPVGELRRWYDASTVPPLCTRIGIIALIDDAAGPCDWKRPPRSREKPVPPDVDLTRPLLHLQAEFGGSTKRYVEMRKEAGISIPAGARAVGVKYGKKE